jgi:hypothetical protein
LTDKFAQPHCFEQNRAAVVLGLNTLWQWAHRTGFSFREPTAQDLEQCRNLDDRGVNISWQ